MSKLENKTPKDMRFPHTDVGEKPRVIFRSFEWKINPKADLSNTESLVQGGETSSTTLFLPANFTEAYSAQWIQEDVFTAGALQGKAGWGASAGELLETSVKKLGADGLLGSFKFATGKTSFPGEFEIFKKVDPISLPFNFDLLPRNAGEANAIVKIVQNFKNKILPTFKNVALTFPDIWTIQFVGVNGLGFPEAPNGIIGYNDMALTNVTAVYGGGTQSSLTFHDGNPVNVQLQLQFKRVRHSYKGSGNP